MGSPEIWINTFVDPRRIAAEAQAYEAEGFDGIALVDNQSVAPDPFVILGIVAAATTRLGLATGTSNSVTRHPAVLAAAAATIAAASGNRMLLSLGRGLSANFELGLPPAPLAQFERYLKDLTGYARGDKVDQRGTTTSLKWPRMFGSPQVPIEVTATGPKVIKIAAPLADRLAFAVGADPDRVRWAIDTAKQARRDAGLDPDGISYGAYVQVYPHSSLDRGIQLARGPVSGLASLSGMPGNHGDGQTSADREQFLLLNRVYDQRAHVMSNGPQAQALDSAFVQRFAAVGPTEQIVERLRAIVDAGVDRLYFSSFPPPDAERDDAAESRHLLTTLIPALQS